MSKEDDLTEGKTVNRRKIAAVAAGALTAAAALSAIAIGQASAAPSNHASSTQAAGAPTGRSHGAKPTVVLVAGAFEDSSSWSGEITELQRDGYPVIAPAVPLRGVASDSAYLTAIVRQVQGKVVLVGHSYAGELITEIAAQDPAQVEGLVYAAATIPKAGQNEQQLLTQFPGSLLGPDTTFTVAYPGGASDTYVKPAAFRSLFAGDMSKSTAANEAARQRPIATSALGEPVAAGVPSGIPVYSIVATHDMAIPPAAERYDAKSVGGSITTVDSAHDLPASHPKQVTRVIERAAR